MVVGVREREVEGVEGRIREVDSRRRALEEREEEFEEEG